MVRPPLYSATAIRYNRGMRYLMYYKDGFLKKYPLIRGLVTIGRGHGCDIALDDPSVSRRHCRVEVSPDRIRLINEKSKNGTTVDNQPVEEAVLALNQSFGVGGHEFFYKEGDVAEFRLSPELAWMSAHLLRPGRSSQPEPETREGGEKYTALLDELSAKALLCEPGEKYLNELSVSLEGLFPGSVLVIEQGKNRILLARHPSPEALRVTEAATPEQPEGRLEAGPSSLFYRRYCPAYAPPGFSLLLVTERPLPRPGGLTDIFFGKVAQLILFNARLAPGLPASQDAVAFEGGGVVIVGRSQEIRQTVAMMRKVAAMQSFILIMGENGTGKELFGRLIHHLSGRKGYVALNCTAIPSQLLESELFGYEAGAFTDARQRKIGRMEEASGGTLVLDEIGDMPVEVQGKLLRVIQERTLCRLGGNRSIPLDLRIVAMTNRDLYRLVEEGKFRQDLFFRLRVHEFTIPPLRERPEDIVPLLQHFIRLHAARIGVAPAGLSESAAACLLAYPWPGNIRELENEVARILEIIDENEIISDHHLLPVIRNARPGPAVPAAETSGFRSRIESAERGELLRLLREHDGNKTRAARAAGLSYQGFLKKLKRLGIGRPKGGDEG